MQVSRVYFHLIRNPRSGARERGKLLTALAIISCITVIVPAGFGITYLIGRIKQVAKNPKASQVAGKIFNHSPVGFPQYGNSCWVASAMQALISSTHLESILRKELKPRKIEELIRLKGTKDWVSNTRDETSEELKQRKTIQHDLIALVEAYKRGEETHKALKEFHQSLIDFSKGGPGAPLDPPGGIGDPWRLLCLIGRVFTEDVMENYLDDPHKNLRWGKEHAPKILMICLHSTTNDPLKADAPWNFFKCQYRLVGAIGKTPGHYMAYVRRGNDWYLCNDSRVNPVSLKNATYESLSIHRLVFDLIEN